MNALSLMRKRLQIRGGTSQQDRIIKDKRETLDRVTLYSYQGARISKLGSDKIVPALINPNQVKQDYDDKIISIGFEYGFTTGTIFEWQNTGTKWLIYLQDLTELAYFKGDIRKCNYEIKWKDEQGQLQSTYIALKGPSEKSINSIIKEGNVIDVPNYSLYMLMSKTDDTVKQFTRYTEFYLQDLETCWRVEAVDSISTPGILEVYAKEYYSNKHEDNIEEGIVGDLIVEPVEPEPTTPEIQGEVFIKPKRTYVYEYVGEEQGSWEWDTKLPLETKIDGNKISLKWSTTYTGQFVLSFGTVSKTIVVESLF